VLPAWRLPQGICHILFASRTCMLVHANQAI
jgi:hypothetical protein